MNLYTLYDKVACKYGPIFEQPNDASALRNCRRLLNSNPDISIIDYVLFSIGKFNNDTGMSDIYAAGPVVVHSFENDNVEELTND